jgi:hypothetical protein
MHIFRTDFEMPLGFDPIFKLPLIYYFQDFQNLGAF